MKFCSIELHFDGRWDVTITNPRSRLQPEVMRYEFALLDDQARTLIRAHGAWDNPRLHLELLYQLSAEADYMVARRRPADAFRAALVRETHRAFHQLPTSAHEPVIAGTSYPWAPKNNRWILVPGSRRHFYKSIRACMREWTFADAWWRGACYAGERRAIRRHYEPRFDWRPPEERGEA